MNDKILNLDLTKELKNLRTEEPFFRSFVLSFFRFCVIICALSFVINAKVYALDLDKFKSLFLSGDYKAAIQEGEQILGLNSNSHDLDELYLILGQSYMKDGNLLRSADIFQIIITEYKNSNFREEAKLSLGDTYFFRQDFDKAAASYKEILNDNPKTKLKADLYYRLSETAFKTGNSQEAELYLSKLKNEFPQGTQLYFDKDLCSLSQVPASDVYYAVQVGSFSNIANAKNLTQRLIQKGYPAYLEESVLADKPSYRVKVGKARQRQEIVNLESRLSNDGYPTKICP